MTRTDSIGISVTVSSLLFFLLHLHFQSVLEAAPSTLTGLCLFQSLLSRTKSLQSDLEGVLKASKDLVSLLDPSAAALIQSESRLLSRGVLRLGQQLSQRLGQLQVRLHE